MMLAVVPSGLATPTGLPSASLVMVVV